MNRFLLDARIALAYLSGHPLYEQIEKEHRLSAPATVTLISVVSKVELLSVGVRNNWDERRMSLLNNLLQSLIIVDINEADRSLMDAWARLNAFSKSNAIGKEPTLSQNDLWIAATAQVANATLITDNPAFEVLQGEYIQVVRYDTGSN